MLHVGYFKKRSLDVVVVCGIVSLRNNGIILWKKVFYKKLVMFTSQNMLVYMDWFYSVYQTLMPG